MNHKDHDNIRAELAHLLDASIAKIEHCLAQLNLEQLWWRPSPETNSIGNLLLHLTGNLKQWAVVCLQGMEDQRDRQREFDERDEVEASELLADLNLVIDEAKTVIEKQEPSNWSKSITIQGFETTILGALLHTITHFVGHTHQIIMLTRLQLGSQYRFHWTPEGERKSVPL